MPAYIDYKDQKIGRVHVLESVERSPCSRWKCLCACGETFVCLARSFKRGDTFECHTCRFERVRGIDLAGRKFGRWTVIERRQDDLGKTVWYVKCDCGNYGLVATCVLGKRGKSMSCGCLGRKEKSKRANTTLYPPSHLTCGSPYYKIRARILQGCYNPKNVAYKDYGAKGVTVCDLWRNGAKDFSQWCIDNKWQEGYVVHLKKGEMVFSPTTCLIMSPEENTREHLAKLITIEGKTLNVYEWSEISGISRHTILDRLTKGYPEEEAVFGKRHKNSGKKKWNDEEIKILYAKGLSLADVGKAMGISYTAVSKRLRFMGIEIDRTAKRRVYVTKECIVCKTSFQPTNSNHHKCTNCKGIKI